MNPYGYTGPFEEAKKFMIMVGVDETYIENYREKEDDKTYAEAAQLDEIQGEEDMTWEESQDDTLGNTALLASQDSTLQSLDEYSMQTDTDTRINQLRAMCPPKYRSSLNHLVESGLGMDIIEKAVNGWGKQNPLSPNEWQS